MHRKETAVRLTRSGAATLGSHAIVVVVLRSHWWNHHGPEGTPPLGHRSGQASYHGGQRRAVVTVTVAKVAVGAVALGGGGRVRLGGALHRLAAAAVTVILGYTGRGRSNRNFKHQAEDGKR